jgi:single-stranded-DNA-specific exonuclease
VQAEVERCARVAPEVLGDAALVRFSSGAQVHPLIATRWARRLAPAAVIAANEGFLPGRVNFAVRTAAETNLLAWLRDLPFTPSADAEYANGHPRATGGSLRVDEFERFIEVLRARGRFRTR